MPAEFSEMKAVVVNTARGPFHIEDIKRPRPAVGQVLVRIKASGLNALDAKIRAGNAPHARHDFPAVLGLEMAGTVEEVAPDVIDFKPGDDVFGMIGGVGNIQGSLAQFAAVDAQLLAHKPSSLSMREAAALPLNFITAWEALIDRMNILPGQTLLVHGGAGGVGYLALQLGNTLGARNFGTGRPSQLKLIESLEATAIDFTAFSPEQYVAEYTHGKGFDFILDTAGDESLEASFRSIAQNGHVVSILGRGTHALGPLSLKGATYSGVFTLYPLLTGINRSHCGAILKAAKELVETGKLKPRLDPTEYGLDGITEAYNALESRTAQGKIVISIS